MADRKTMTITWPFAGVHKGRGYQQTAPFTCPAASNVRTVDTLDGRRRGGRRPGLTQAYPELGTDFSTIPARLLRQITTLSGRRLVAAANHKMFQEDDNGQMATLGWADCDVSNYYNLEAAEYMGELFVADRGGIGYIYDTGLVSVYVQHDTPTAGKTKLSFAYGLYQNFEMAGVLTGQTVVLTDRDPDTIHGTFTVESVSAATMVLTGSAGATGNAWAYIERGPKVWNAEDKTLRPLVPTAGNADAVLGYRLVCRYSNRLFWAGNPDIPYAWICSRSGDPLDYDFSWGLDDVARATYWQASDQKTIGQPIKALIPFGNDFLLFGCTNSLWMLTGDPTYGGSLGQVDPNVGVLSGTSWCYLPGVSAMILSHDGLYIVSGRTVMPVSQGKLPKELVGINPSLYTISMAYEPRHRGVHIIASKTATATHELPIAYWYDIVDQAFWPVAFDYTVAKDQSPLRAELQLLDNGSSRVLLATKHGEVAYFNDAAVKDLNDTTGTAVTGTVTLGPFRLGADDFSEGMLTKMVGILDAQSANVTWTVHVADTAEGAIAAAAHSTGTWTPGRSMPEYVRARGAAMCIKLSGTGKWAFEAAVAEIERLGLVRAL